MQCGCLAKVQTTALEGLRDSFMSQFSQLKSAVSQRSVILPALFVFLWQVWDVSFTFYLTDSSAFL